MRLLRPGRTVALWLFWTTAVALLIGVFLPSSRSISYFHSPGLGLLWLLVGLATLLCFPKSWRRHSGVSQGLSHLGFVLVLLGVLVSGRLAKRGVLALPEGGMSHQILLQTTGMQENLLDLPSSLRLLRFEIDTYGPPLRELHLLHWSDSKQRWIPLKTVPAQPGEILETAGWRIRVVHSVDMTGGPGESLVVLVGPKEQEEQRVLFASEPHDPQSFLAQDLRLFYSAHVDVKAYRSTLQVEKNGTQGEVLVTEVNQPAHWEGWRIYQESYWEDQGRVWSRMEFVQDPGVGVVFLGYLFLVLGGLFGVLNGGKPHAE